MSEIGTFSYIDGTSAIDMNTTWNRDDSNRHLSRVCVVPQDEATIWDDLRVAREATGYRDVIDDLRYGSTKGVQEPFDALGLRPVHGVLLFLICLGFILI